MIQELRSTEPKLLVTGNHTDIIQSILDFDYYSGKQTPSICVIVSANRRVQKFFWGAGEILVPVVPTIEDAVSVVTEVDFLLNITSASSVPNMVQTFFRCYPNALGAHIFAENVAERDALSLIEMFGRDSDEPKFIAGPSGVGLYIPGVLKLGAIGGISRTQIEDLASADGGVAIICTSGGMTNEILYQVSQSGSGVSFAVSFGGDRFPITSPVEWMLEAEEDPKTEAILFFGEIGGKEEYAIRDMIRDGHITKPVYAYIAGHYDTGATPIQFGHAKALAKEASETALAKMEALEKVGVHTAHTFIEFAEYFHTLPKTSERKMGDDFTPSNTLRRTTLFSSPRTTKNNASSFTEAILKRLLMRESVSKELVTFTDAVLVELIDHGPNVSGAVNTMVTTRAGKDMVSSLASGILTIGDRFGGAVNAAADVWFSSRTRDLSPEDLVSSYSKSRDLIPGIGHLKYNRFNPDPRIKTLISLGETHLPLHAYTSYAQHVERLTMQKRQNLILNVDGAIAALFLDYLLEKEYFTESEVKELIHNEFFNSFFVIARSVGFIGNHLDQRRIDEGLFRLKDDDIHFF